MILMCPTCYLIGGIIFAILGVLLIKKLCKKCGSSKCCDTKKDS